MPVQDHQRETYRGLTLHSIPHPIISYLLSRSGDSTSGATSALLIGHPALYQWLELRAEVRHVERLFANDGRYLVYRSTAVPTQAIYRLVRTTPEGRKK